MLPRTTLKTLSLISFLAGLALFSSQVSAWTVEQRVTAVGDTMLAPGDSIDIVHSLVVTLDSDEAEFSFYLYEFVLATTTGITYDSISASHAGIAGNLETANYNADTSYFTVSYNAALEVIQSVPSLITVYCALSPSATQPDASVVTVDATARTCTFELFTISFNTDAAQFTVPNRRYEIGFYPAYMRLNPVTATRDGGVLGDAPTVTAPTPLTITVVDVQATQVIRTAGPGDRTGRITSSGSPVTLTGLRLEARNDNGELDTDYNSPIAYNARELFTSSDGLPGTLISAITITGPSFVNGVAEGDLVISNTLPPSVYTRFNISADPLMAFTNGATPNTATVVTGLVASPVVLGLAVELMPRIISGQTLNLAPMIMAVTSGTANVVTTFDTAGSAFVFTTSCTLCSNAGAISVSAAGAFVNGEYSGQITVTGVQLADLANPGDLSLTARIEGIELQLLDQVTIIGDVVPPVVMADLAAMPATYRVGFTFTGATDQQVEGGPSAPLTSANGGQFALFYAQAGQVSGGCSAAAAALAGDSSTRMVPLTSVAASNNNASVAHASATPLSAATPYCAVIRATDAAGEQSYSNVLAFMTEAYSIEDANSNGVPDDIDTFEGGLSSFGDYLNSIGCNLPRHVAYGVCDTDDNGIADVVDLYYGRIGDTNITVNTHLCVSEGVKNRVAEARANLNCSTELPDLSSYILHTTHFAIVSSNVVATTPETLGNRRLGSGTYWLSDGEGTAVKLNLLPVVNAGVNELIDGNNNIAVAVRFWGPSPQDSTQTAILRIGGTEFRADAFIDETGVYNDEFGRVSQVQSGMNVLAGAVLNTNVPASSTAALSFSLSDRLFVSAVLSESTDNTTASARIDVSGILHSSFSARNSVTDYTGANTRSITVNGEACTDVAISNARTFNARRASFTITCSYPASAVSAGLRSVVAVEIGAQSFVSRGADTQVLGAAVAPDSDGNRIPDSVDGSAVNDLQSITFAYGQGMARTVSYLRTSPGPRLRAGTTALANYASAPTGFEMDSGINVAGLRDNPADQTAQPRNGALDLDFELRCDTDLPFCLSSAPVLVFYAAGLSGLSAEVPASGASTQPMNCSLPLPATVPTGCEALSNFEISFAAAEGTICPAYNNEAAWSQTVTGQQPSCVRVTAPIDLDTGFFAGINRFGYLGGGGIDPFGGSGGGGGSYGLLGLLILFGALALALIVRLRSSVIATGLAALLVLGYAADIKPASAQVSMDDLMDFRLSKLSVSAEYLQANFDRDNSSQVDADDSDDGFRISASWDIDNKPDSGLAVDAFWVDYGGGEICAGENSGCSNPISPDISGFGVGLSWHFPIGGNNSVYLGAGYSDLEADGSSDDLSSDSEDSTYYEAGLVWRDLSWLSLSDRWSLKVSYNYLDSAGIDYYAVGLGYNFGKPSARTSRPAPERTRRAPPRRQAATVGPKPKKAAETPRRRIRTAAPSVGTGLCANWNTCRCQVPISGNPKGWYVQVVAYYQDDSSRIEGMTRRLRNSGYRDVGTVNKRDRVKGRLTILRLGGISTCAEAERVKRSVDRMFDVDSLIRPYYQTPF